MGTEMKIESRWGFLGLLPTLFVLPAKTGHSLEGFIPYPHGLMLREIRKERG